jgi:hypothetical protein
MNNRSPYSNAYTRRRRKRNLAAILLIGLLITIAVSCGNANRPPVPGHMVTETYIVQSGDTLDAISYKFMSKSSVLRDVREFREGIIQLNWDEVFKGRYPYGVIYPGDSLLVNYWVKK